MSERIGCGLVCIACLLMVAGCGTSSGENADVELPDWLSDDSATDEPAAPAVTGDPATGGPAIPSAPPLETAQLDLRLNPGDRFPLHKVVRQELTQAAPGGPPVVSRSELDLLLAITVEEVQAGRTRLGVRYNQVRYSLEMPGHRMAYDSRTPPATVPPEVQAYHAMVNDGFSFWIGADNQIAEVVGFKEFVDRCVQGIPEEHRQQSLLAIEADSGERGIANFVDNTIGLLPYGTQKAAGDTWTRSQRIARPVPLEINTLYTLTRLSPEEAEVNVDGTILPSTTVSQVDASGGVRIVVRGGRTAGTCTLFRDTGLPRESRVIRTVDMVVQMSGGVEFEQQNRTETIVEAFPASSAAPLPLAESVRSSAVQPATHAVESFAAPAPPTANGAAINGPRLE